MIIGTAGHIDHGKSALVTALTGTAVDRLAEERRRGITIELNFAALSLADRGPIGIVDVPGHEDFVRTMVAGASGIDLVLLVIDAAEGPRPQTLEHLLVVEQLGVPRGIPVLTKSDLVAPDWLELVREDVAALVAASPVRFTAPVAVSAVSGEGIDALRSAIAAEADQTSGRSDQDLLRLPVDRTFSLPGVGTVVTGTVWSGSVRAGDTVTILPGGARARVRSIQSFGQDADTAGAGARAALGLVGIDRDQAPRGSTLVGDQAPWQVATALDVLLSVAPGAPAPLARRTRVRVHLGTSEVMARVYPRTPVAPGATGPARLALESPLVARGGDRLVLRRYSPVTTIGGALVLDPAPPRRSRWPGGLESADPAERLIALIERRPAGIAPAEAPVLAGGTAGELERLVEAEPTMAVIAGRWTTKRRVEAAQAEVVALVEAYHGANPSEPGLSLETLRSRLAAKAWLADAVVDALVSVGRLRSAEGRVARAEFAPRAGGGEGEVVRVVTLLREAGLTPPTVAELADQGFTDLPGALRMAVDRGEAVQVERDRYFAREALNEFSTAVREVAGSGEISPGSLRDRLGLSRKYLIPLLEWGDRSGLTRRTADGTRVLI